MTGDGEVATYDVDRLGAGAEVYASVVLPASCQMGPVELTVSSIERSLRYYRESIGLELLGSGGAVAQLGAGGGELLRLVEEPGARPADGYAGLFHFALRVPERADLAHWLAHAARTGVPLTGASDHFVSEALYLHDPDRHGIEIYWDRPRALWEGQVGRMGTWPLDLEGLLAEAPAAPFERLAAGTVMGHVHLRVSDLGEAVGFYRDVLGLDLMAQLGDQAAFLSAGGYHHHVGVNTWESTGAPSAPDGTATLRRFTIVVPGGEPRTLVDPSGNVLDVVSGSSGGPLLLGSRT